MGGNFLLLNEYLESIRLPTIRLVTELGFLHLLPNGGSA